MNGLSTEETSHRQNEVFQHVTNGSRQLTLSSLWIKFSRPLTTLYCQKYPKTRTAKCALKISVTCIDPTFSCSAVVVFSPVGRPDLPLLFSFGVAQGQAHNDGARKRCMARIIRPMTAFSASRKVIRRAYRVCEQRIFHGQGFCGAQDARPGGIDLCVIWLGKRFFADLLLSSLGGACFPSQGSGKTSNAACFLFTLCS